MDEPILMGLLKNYGPFVTAGIIIAYGLVQSMKVSLHYLFNQELYPQGHRLSGQTRGPAARGMELMFGGVDKIADNSTAMLAVVNKSAERDEQILSLITAFEKKLEGLLMIEQHEQTRTTVIQIAHILIELAKEKGYETGPIHDRLSYVVKQVKSGSTTV